MIFANKKWYSDFKNNGAIHHQKRQFNRKGKKLLSYYVVITFRNGVQHIIRAVFDMELTRLI
jgi:hypothetical protein